MYNVINTITDHVEILKFVQKNLINVKAPVTSYKLSFKYAKYCCIQKCNTLLKSLTTVLSIGFFADTVYNAQTQTTCISQRHLIR